MLKKMKMLKKIEILEYLLLSIVTFSLIYPIKNIRVFLFAATISLLIVSYINNRKEFIKFYVKPNWITYPVYIWFIFYSVIQIFTDILPFSFNSFAILFSFLIYLYYSQLNNKKAIYTIFFVSLFTLFILSVTTLCNLNNNYSISRVLSTGDKEKYDYFGIGSYSFAYGSIFVLMALLLIIKNKALENKYKIIIAIYIVLQIICLVKMAFLISILLLLLGMLLLLLRINSIKKLLIFILVGLSLIFVVAKTPVALKVLDSTYNVVENEYIRSRINDIRLIVKGEKISSTNDLRLRLEVYSRSVHLFLKSPIIGSLNPNITDIQTGGHSLFLDELARFGIVFSMPLFIMLYTVYRNIKLSFKNKAIINVLFVEVICFIILGIINTALFPTLVFIIMSVSPTILQFADIMLTKKERSANMNDELKIDIVLPWVDSNDKKWQIKKSKFTDNEIGNDNSEDRYRDWDNLKFVFRSIEKYAPWVNKVYFVTCGQTPSWLNINNPKLILVNHNDYIPEQYLPTFNSHTIELNLHRINSLSEYFIYFNDDTFLINNTKPTDFFVNKKPCDSPILTNYMPNSYYDFSIICLNMIGIINKNFNKREVIKKNYLKFFNLKYGKLLFRTIYFSLLPRFSGFYNEHLPNAFLKSTFDEVWNKETEVLDLTCKCHVRNIKTNVNQWLIKYWQFAQGNFNPRSPKIGKYFDLSSDISKIEKYFKGKKGKMICLNDSNIISNFEIKKKEINKLLLNKFPEKCSFEK